MKLLVIDSGKKSSREQMQLDEELLCGIEAPVLRFYAWLEPCVTYGYFINPDDWLYTQGLDLARRPTGGGLIFHEHDFSFTLALPVDHPFCTLATLERYQAINNKVIQALSQLVGPAAFALQSEEPLTCDLTQLCMAHPTKYDLLLSGKKVGGSSQRKNKLAFIHQSSLFLEPIDWPSIKKWLKDPENVLPVLQNTSASVFSSQRKNRESFRQALKAVLQMRLQELIC